MALKACGTPTVLILAGGSPISVPYDIAEAILFMWYPGEEGGNAVTDILFGDTVPAGRLPITFPKSVDQLPPYEDYSMQGRTYRYATEEPLFPFGFGLSYTRFSYHSLHLSASELQQGERLEVKVDVTNEGDVAAEEVVQLYLTDIEASTETPFYSLKGFRRVFIRAKDTATVTFTLTPDMMALIDDHGKPVIEPGAFTVTIGGSSPGIRSQELGAAPHISATFTVIE